MLKSKIVSVVNICSSHARTVIILSILLTVLTGLYSSHNFLINTDINKLISPDLPWRQRELAVDKAFPHRNETILVVVEAPTSELATQATALLVDRLSQQADRFPMMRELGGSDFFAKSALLFLPTEQVSGIATQFSQAQPLIRVLVSDANWRGLIQALTFALAGIQRNMYTLDEMTRPLTMFSTTIEDAIAGRPASFSWRELAARRASEPSELRRVIEIKPVLDYAALEPGEVATRSIRQAVADLKLETDYQARVRLTGPVAIQDEELLPQERRNVDAA